MSEGFVTANGIKLHYVEAGHGPAVVLLHGFPDFWYLWRRQLPALEAAGFRAIAPDLRGYNLSARPSRVADYKLETLINDVIAFCGSVADNGCALAGHDWGGFLAWYAAARRPDLFHKLVIFNTAHPARYRQLLRLRSSQLWRSWYFGLFQLPGIPERLMHARLQARIRRAATRPTSSRTPEELMRYAAVFNSPHSYREPLHYYRAAARGLLTGANTRIERITMPTLVLWGDRDPFLDVRNVQGLERWVTNLRVVHFPTARHWPMLEEPEEVNREIINFLQE